MKNLLCPAGRIPPQLEMINRGRCTLVSICNMYDGGAHENLCRRVWGGVVLILMTKLIRLLHRKDFLIIIIDWPMVPFYNYHLTGSV